MSEQGEQIDLTQDIPIGMRIFETREAAKEYFTSLIRDIGPCSSIKQKNETLFYIIVDLLKRHPNRVRKGLVDGNGECQILDIEVCKASISEGSKEVLSLYLCAVLSGPRKLKVTWTKCLVSREEGFFHQLREALRYEIQPQIDYFQEVFQTAKQCAQVLSIMGSRCIHCMADKNIDLVEADYFALFPVLAEQFILLFEPSKLPSEFDLCPDTFWYKMKDAHSSFKERWVRYFFNHAKPRWVCYHCLHDPTLYLLT